MTFRRTDPWCPICLSERMRNDGKTLAEDRIQYPKAGDGVSSSHACHNWEMPWSSSPGTTGLAFSGPSLPLTGVPAAPFQDSSHPPLWLKCLSQQSPPGLSGHVKLILLFQLGREWIVERNFNQEGNKHIYSGPMTINYLNIFADLLPKWHNYILLANRRTKCNPENLNNFCPCCLNLSTLSNCKG